MIASLRLEVADLLDALGKPGGDGLRYAEWLECEPIPEDLAELAELEGRLDEIADLVEQFRDKRLTAAKFRDAVAAAVDR